LERRREEEGLEEDQRFHNFSPGGNLTQIPKKGFLGLGKKGLANLFSKLGWNPLGNFLFQGRKRRKKGLKP